MTATGFARNLFQPGLWLAAMVLAGSAVAALKQDDLLPPEEAFRFSARGLGPEGVEVRFQIADGYYMYREKFRFSSRTDGVTVGPAVLPAGKMKDDETFGRVETYRGGVAIRLPVRAPASRSEFVLEAVSQGCADAGLCYVPQKQTARLQLAAVTPEDVSPGGSGGVLSKLRKLTTADSAPPEFLPVQKAFRVDLQAVDATTLVAELAPAPGYYLYRDKTRFSAAKDSGADIGAVTLPPGELKSDPNFGETLVWHQPVRVTVPLRRQGTGRSHASVDVGFQGCAEAGLCYPPTTRRFEIVLAAFEPSSKRADAPAVTAPAAQTATPPATTAPGPASAPPATAKSQALDESSKIARILRSGNFWLIIASFFGFGILLSFTPCVLPMVPILSGIIVGQGHKVTRGHAFSLSAVYVGGMAITYAIAGVAAGLSGTLLSNALQDPRVLGAFAGLFVLLSLSMFGFYELQLPASLQSRLSDTSNRMKGGSFWGVFAMGVLSALIVGPCVAAPLAGALLYINQSRDAVLGGSALFAMALGMGVPLMAVGLSAGTLLPKAGAWMQTVKNLFGVVLLGLAIWIISPVIAAVLHMLLWAGLLICSAVYLHALDPLPHNASGFRKLFKGVGVIALLVGVALLAGALSGGRDILQPLSGLRAARSVPDNTPRFERVASVAQLDSRLAQAAGRAVMLDFYADWCVSCKEMERFTFTDPAVQARMNRMLLLKADVTANTPEDAALLERFGLFGPPGTIFFDGRGRELSGLRVIGFEPAGRFVGSLDAVLEGS
jgi:thiol:disulfide interchange protein DsbD